jgi:hypothetical protein
MDQYIQARDIIAIKVGETAEIKEETATKSLAAAVRAKISVARFVTIASKCKAK